MPPKCQSVRGLRPCAAGDRDREGRFLENIRMTNVFISEWLMNASLFQASNPYSINILKKGQTTLVNEMDGAPSRNFFTVLNIGQFYTEDQFLNIYTFSILYKWLHHTYSSTKRTSAFENSDSKVSSTCLKIYAALIGRTVEYCFRVLDQCERIIPVKGPLRLSRDACVSRYTRGPNVGKCGRMAHLGYVGDYCLDHFKIPEEHLDGFMVWEYSGTVGKEIYKPGPGIPDADFVLYVNAQTTHHCLKGTHQKIAYAAYCQVDQNGRPIAGYLNFCPSDLLGQGFDEHQTYYTIIHDVFHTLGFSNDLFSKFRDCRDSASKTNCSVRRGPVFAYIQNNIPRLVTPAVKLKTQNHFGCSLHHYGGPLVEENGVPGSHWNTRFMYGSIMSPTLGPPHLTVIDPITLAVFEDSGWYKVEYNRADNFYWGRGEGCSFGSLKTCQTNNLYFCSTNKTGCHYMHYDKAPCVADRFTSSCHIFMPKPNDSCLLPTTIPLMKNIHGEMYTPFSRCFLSSLTSEFNGVADLIGRCYEHRCLTPSLLQVKIQGSVWTKCLPGDFIKVQGYNGILRCPENPERICENQFSVYTTKPPRISNNAVITSTRTPTDHSFQNTVQVIDTSKYILDVNLKFPNANFSYLEAEHLLENFREKNIAIICNLTAVHRERLNHIAVTEGSVIFAFNLLPSKQNKTGPPSMEAYSVLEKKVRMGTFVVDLEEDGMSTPYTATDIGYVMIRVDSSTSHPFPTLILSVAAIVAIVLGCLCFVTLLMLFWIFIYKVRSAIQRISPGSSTSTGLSIELQEQRSPAVRLKSPALERLLKYHSNSTDLDTVSESSRENDDEDEEEEEELQTAV